jgi:hypothetical protein
MSFLRTYRCLPLFLVVVAVIFTSPVSHTGWKLGLFFGVLWAVLLGLTGFMIYPTRSWLRTYIVLVLLEIVFLAIHSSAGSPMWSMAAITLTALAINIAVFYVVMRHALFTKVNREFDRTVAAVAGYFILGLIWAKLYELIILADPEALRSGGEFISARAGDTITYYSLVTLTTLGYGDITPLNPFARLLSSFESGIGTLYIAVVIASLVGKAIADRKFHPKR